MPAWTKKNQNRSEGYEEITGQLGLTRQEITKGYLQVYGRVLADWLLRQQIIPMLENSGLINQEPDPNDKRKILIYPTDPLTISDKQNNSELSGGVSEKWAGSPLECRPY